MAGWYGPAIRRNASGKIVCGCRCPENETPEPSECDFWGEEKPPRYIAADLTGLIPINKYCNNCDEFGDRVYVLDVYESLGDCAWSYAEFVCQFFYAGSWRQRHFFIHLQPIWADVAHFTWRWELTVRFHTSDSFAYYLGPIRNIADGYVLPENLSLEDFKLGNPPLTSQDSCNLVEADIPTTVPIYLP